jgi:hypothetical protein
VREITLIIPAFNQPKMLRRQLDEVAKYPPQWRVIVVDDHSTVPALEVFEAGDKAELYRVDADVPWNRSMARNLGAQQAQTEWIVHVDTDHILPAHSAACLLVHPLDAGAWYRFPRFRYGKADDTRNKDQIPRDAEFGQIGEHVDSYLITKTNYWRTGGYDPDYAGCLGGGGAFVARLEAMLGRSAALPPDIQLNVYTKHVIHDASVSGINRDTSEYKRRKRDKEARGDVVPHDPIRYPWHRVR